MTYRVGGERRNEFAQLYFPIVRDGALGESVGTAYDRETAALFAAAPELLALVEDFFHLIPPGLRQRLKRGGERQKTANELPRRLRAAVSKAKGGKP